MGSREDFLNSLRPSTEGERAVGAGDEQVTFYDADSGALGQPEHSTGGKLRENFRQASHDAPETDHNGKGAEIGAYEARDHFLNLLRDNPGTEARSTGDKDFYGRGNVTEFITPDGENLNVEMIRSGLTIPLGGQTQEVRNAATAATFNTMTGAGDVLTGDAAHTNAVARRVQAETSFALDNGLIPNPALRDFSHRVRDNGVASDAYNRGVHNTKAMLHGFGAAVADAVGADGFKESELHAAEDSQTKAGAFYSRMNTWDDVHNVSDGATYALEKTIENLPIIGVTAASALATGGGSLAAEGVLGAVGMRAAAGAAARVGMKHGAAAALYGVNTGDTALQLKENGVEDFGTTALAVGVPKTMLDYASLASMTRGVTAAVSSAAKGKGFDPIKAGTDFIANVGREGGTEGVQQIVDNAAVSYKTGNEFNLDHVKESMIAGGVVGGAFGVAQATPGAVVSAAKGAKGIITSREPQQDIQAQLQAQSEGAKPATFVSESNSDSFDAQVEAGGEGATVLRSPEGQLVTQHPVSEAERTAYENGTPEERSAVNAAHIGYGADKSAIDPETAKVVQVVAPTGGVVHEEVTNNPEEIAANLEATKRPDDAVQVTDALQAQIRRVEATGQELSAKAVEVHNAIQQMVEQGADVADIQAAASEYEAIAAEIEKAQQLHAQLSEGTISAPQTNDGVTDAGDTAGYVASDVQRGGELLQGAQPESTASRPGTVGGRVSPDIQTGELLGSDSSNIEGSVGLPAGRGSSEGGGSRDSTSDAAGAGQLGSPVFGGAQQDSIGNQNGQPTRLADDAAGNAPDAGAERAGGNAGAPDNGARPVDSGTAENNSVADRSKGPRVSFTRLGLDEQRAIVGRARTDVQFQNRLTAYKAQGYSFTDSLEFALADEKISAEDIPNDYNPSSDNSLFDETELPSQDSVYSPEDVDAQSNIKNYATKAYYGALLEAHQEAFTARHPTWELVPRAASNKDFFLDPQPRAFTTRTEAETEAARLEPLYYGYVFKTVASPSGQFMLTRHKVNASLSTDAMHPTRSWAHQALPKIKLQARGAEAAIKRATVTLDNLAKSVANHSGNFYKRRTAEMHQQIQDNVDKLIKLRTPNGEIIQVHAPTLTEQGKHLLGEYGSYTSRAQYEFLAFKQALSGLSAMGYHYDEAQGPTEYLFSPELNISSSGTPLRVKDIVDIQTALSVHENALRIATDELYRLEGLLKAARAKPVKPGEYNRVRKEFMDKVVSQRKLVEDLRLHVDNFKSVDPTGKDPYVADTLATEGVSGSSDVADGRSEVDKFTDNFNRAASNETRVEAKGFAGDSSGFYDQSKVGTSSETPAVDSGDTTPTAEVKNAVAAFLRKYPGASSVTVLYRIGAEGEKAKYAPATDTLYVYTNNVTDGADLSRSLHHELLVHKGLGLYDTKRITAVFASLKSAVTRTGALKDAFESIQNDPYYSKLAEREQLEELLAFVAEGINSGLIARTFNRVTIALRSALKALGIIDSTNVNFAEVEAIVHDIAHAYKTGMRRSLRGDQQATFWRTITGMDGVFKYGKSAAKSLEDIAAELEGPSGFTAYEDEALAMQNEHGATKSWRIDMPEGGKAGVFQVGNRVWLDIHESSTGTGGSAVYNIVANYAYNNGKVFIGDPAGLSDTALSRRLENMLSSALKFGTTNHIAPHPDQLKGGHGVPPLKWVAGDTWGNIASMLESSYASTRSQIPEVDDYRFDPATDTIVNRKTGKILGAIDAQRLAEQRRLARGVDSGNGGRDGSQVTAGRSSITRAILGGTFLRSQGRARSDLLAALSNVQSERLQDAFYRLDSAAIQLKFHELRKSKLASWFSSLRGASTSFANLVLTGYEQMKKLHPATAERFRQYQAHKNQMAAYWLGVWHNNIGLSTERTQAAFAELRALGEAKVVRRSDVSADAWALRKYLDEIHTSMLKKYSPTMGKVPNYLPQPVDTRAMISDKNAFVEILLRHPMDVRNGNAQTMTPEEADGVFNALLGNSGLDGLTVDELEGAVGVGNKHRYQRVLRNPALIAELDSAGFMFADKLEAMEYYVTQGVNRSAFERVFGGYRPVVALLDHNGAINEGLLKDKMSQAGHGELVKSGLTPDSLLNEAISMGYAKMVDGYVHWYSPVSKMHDARERLRGDASNLRKFDDLTHGMLGFFGDRVSSETKLWQSRIMAGESLLTLAFSTFSSQTDWAGPAMRVMQDKGVAAAWAELKSGMRAFSNHKQAQDFATAFGFIVPRQHQSVIRSMGGADHMSAGAQKTLDTLFKYNGQEWFTNQTRAFAASTGIHYFKTLAAADDAILQSYGIDTDVVTRWIAAGEHAPTQSMERNDKKAFDDAMAVHTALHKFVNESIMRPDSTQRPNWANDPRFALLWHLKSFFWAFWSTIMKPTFKSAFTQMKAGNYVEGSAQLALTGLLLLPLAAVGWELRQLIQYSLFGEDQPSDSMDGVDYTFELLSRAGVFGPAQLAFDALGTEDSGRAVARLAGPAADHLYTLLHAETDKKIYRSIPILSQLYGAQKAISD